jgi:DNA-binding beta-propeller fold protein YncE
MMGTFKKTAVIILLLTTIVGQAQAAPYYSYMITRDGYYRFSPSLYEPSFVSSVDVTGVEDLFVAQDDHIYVVRSGLRAVVQELDAEGELLREYGEGKLQKPTGLFVDSDGLIYIADSGLSAVLLIGRDDTLIQSYTRPATPLFGARTPFVPKKVAVDKQGNVYIVSEGSTNGIIQLDRHGDFLGYFGVNLSDRNLLRKIQKAVFPDEIMSMFIRNIPSSISNIAIDTQGLIYATTKGETREPIKKMNIAGENLFTDVLVGIYGGEDLTSLSLESVAVDQYGNVFAVSGTTGHVFVMDNLGNIVGLFGDRRDRVSEIGVTMNPAAIAVNSAQQLLIADRGNGTITFFSPTPLMDTLFKAMAMYKQGLYVQSEALWREVLMKNANVALANRALGLSQFKKLNFSQALDYFYKANDKKGYSNAFWELRQAFLMRNMPAMLLGIACLFVVNAVWRRIRRRMRWFDPLSRFAGRVGRTAASRQIRAVVRVVRHPADCLYDVRFMQTVSPAAAAATGAVSLLLILAGPYFYGFVFNTINTANTWSYSPIQTGVTYGAAALLFVLSNHMIASIRGGRGSLKHVFIGTMVCTAPIALFYIPYIALSNLLTLQEGFIIQFIRYGLLGWCGLLILIMVMQVQDYGFGEAVRCLLLTVFTMMIIFVICVVVFILGRELVLYLYTIAEEVALRAIYR